MRERLQRPHAHLFAAGRRVTACKLVRGPTEAKGSLGNLIVMRGVWLPFEYSARLVSNFLSLWVSFPLINLCIPMFFLPLCSELGVLTTPPWFSLLLQTSPAAQLRLLKAGDTLLPPPSAEPPALREGGREGGGAEGGCDGQRILPGSLLPSQLAKETPSNHSLQQTATSSLLNLTAGPSQTHGAAVPPATAPRPEPAAGALWRQSEAPSLRGKFSRLNLGWVLTEPQPMMAKKVQLVSSSLKNKERGCLWFQEEYNV